MSKDALVKVEHVSFSYPNGTEALRDLSLEVEPGQIVGIVGPSGCGKSSLLALLAQFTRSTAGQIVWSKDLDPKRHKLSMVFQKDTLLPWLTVEENIHLFRTLNRRRAVDLGAPVDELLALAGLADFRRAYPYQLSGGMRRRTAFVSAMAAMPELLLLDEPFSALDEPTRIAIHQDVLEIVRRHDTSVILVTHDLAEAATICDEILVLSARPARVVSRFKVPFPRNREVLGLRQTPEFLELYGDLWHELSVQIRGGSETSGGGEGQ